MKCRHYAQADEGNIIKFGKSKQGVQRYRCKNCATTFAATRGTLFYRKHAPVKDIPQTLALLAEGVRISSLSERRASEDTILRWLREAARHAEAVEDVLLEDYRLSKAQVDGLWAYVGNKGQGATKEGAGRRVLALHADREREWGAGGARDSQERDGGRHRSVQAAKE